MLQDACLVDWFYLHIIGWACKNCGIWCISMFWVVLARLAPWVTLLDWLEWIDWDNLFTLGKGQAFA